MGRIKHRSHRCAKDYDEQLCLHTKPNGGGAQWLKVRESTANFYTKEGNHSAAQMVGRAVRGATSVVTKAITQEDSKNIK